MVLESLTYKLATEIQPGTIVAFDVGHGMEFGLMVSRTVSVSAARPWLLPFKEPDVQAFGQSPMYDSAQLGQMGTLVLTSARIFPIIASGTVGSTRLPGLVVSGDRMFIHTKSNYFDWYFDIRTGKESSETPRPHSIVLQWSLQTKDPNEKWVELISY